MCDRFRLTVLLSVSTVQDLGVSAAPATVPLTVPAVSPSLMYTWVPGCSGSNGTDLCRWAKLVFNLSLLSASF